MFRFVQLSVIFLIASIQSVVLGVDIIAHRANGCGLTENSIGAVRSALAAEVDAIELDVRVSRDGVVYLFHDDEIDNRPVLAMEYGELQLLAGLTGTPRLSEVLAHDTFTGFYLLDLKQIDTNMATQIVKTVRDSGVNLSQVIFQSDDTQVLHTLHEMLPTGRYYLLEHLKRRFPFFRTVKAASIAGGITQSYIEGVSLKGRSFIDKRWLSALKNAGLRVFVWTINDESRAHYYQAIGVDGLITDIPLNMARRIGREGHLRSGACDRL